MASSSGNARRTIAGSPFATAAVAPPPSVDYSVGDRVCHDRFGMGTVVVVGFPDVLRIDFGTEGLREFRSNDPSITAL